MKKHLRTVTLSAMGIIGVAALAYAAGTTTDYLYIKPGGGGTPPSNNTIAFENAGTIDFRAAGSVDAGADLTLDATNDIDMIAGNGRITLNTATGIQFWDAILPSVAGYGGTGININAEGINQAMVNIPVGGGAITISAPTNPHDGEFLMIRFKQPASGTLGTSNFNTGAGGFRFGTSFTSTLTAAFGKTDYFYFCYNSDAGKWDCIAANKNF